MKNEVGSLLVCLYFLVPMMPSETLTSDSSLPLKQSSSSSHTKSKSKWLQRLRSSRGFPDSDHIDLQHFLSHESHPTEEPNNVLSEKHVHNNNNNNNNDTGSVQVRDSINNLLSDLFYMGDCPRIRPKKTCRKQPCPRVCDVSRKNRVSSGRNRVKEVELEEERVDGDLSAYSQTEVTVIDTSVPCWKFEKVLYRSKNVWKLGDRKGKGCGVDRKKRKQTLIESVGGVHKKKLKRLKNKLNLCASSNKYAEEEEEEYFKSDQGYEQGKMLTGNEKKRDNCSQVQEKSFSKKQIDEGSSVILIKSIPTTSKKNVSGASNSCVKSMQR